MSTCSSLGQGLGLECVSGKIMVAGLILHQGGEFRLASPPFSLRVSWADALPLACCPQTRAPATDCPCRFMAEMPLTQNPGKLGASATDKRDVMAQETPVGERKARGC